MNREIDLNQQRTIFLLGASLTLLGLAGIFLDVIAGSISGGNLTELPQTAVERFAQFQKSRFDGLYNLDFLNTLIQIILIPSVFVLFLAHREKDFSYSLLAFILFIFGSCIMVANNKALPMMELSDKYFSTANETQKGYYAAAGESLIAQGAHGSPGIFFGFFLPNVANLIMSLVMLKNKIFSRYTAWTGIFGSLLMMLYVVLVNFGSGVEKMATAFAMPGGILLMIWMILYTLRLFRLAGGIKKS